MIDDAISRIKRAMTEGTFDFGQVCCGAYEWSGSPDEPPECCGRPLSCADDVRALLAEVGRLRKENHDLNWALGTDGYATLSDPEDQAASDAAHAAAFANLDRLKARKTRHETLLPDGRDALDEIERLREALTAANAQAEHFEREWYLRGDEIERLRADVSVAAREAQTLRNQRDELRIILDKRPAMNDGLREAYAKWSAGVYALDWMDAADIDAARKEDGK